MAKINVCTATLKSITRYSQSRMHDAPKEEKEVWEDYEKRTWKEKAHVDGDGVIFIPPMAFKMCLDSCAKYLSIQIPGKGKSTYTKHFLSGMLCMDPLSTGVNVEDVQGEWINANSDGVRGSGKRVKRCYPVIESWEGDIDFYILDPTLTKKVFEEVLGQAGQFRGIGRFRPENGGFYGRFEVVNTNWETQ